MTTLNSSPVPQNPHKLSGFSGCIVTALAIFFAILGICDFAFGSILAYIFSSAHMLSLASIATVLIIACDCFIYFFLVFRIETQHWLISLVLLVVAWLVLPLPLGSFINTATMRLRVNGSSMETTLPNGSYILANKLAYQQNEPQRGDLIILQSPSSSSSLILIKRVIGLPGEVVSISQGQVSINGAPITEPYVSAKATYNGEWKVPEGEYFVLGDNRPDSFDSHNSGFVPLKNIIAKAVWIYFPFTNFGEIVGFDFAP